MVSILILTLNEEANLPRCLKSVSWSDDIVVLDSFSSDQTEEIARSAGVRFVQRKFDNYSAHRNWSLTDIDYKHPWVLVVDADEIIPANLRREIESVVTQAPVDMAAYRLRFKNMFMGRWIKHSSLYPTYITRLLRVGRVRYEDRLVNAHPIIDGRMGELKNHFLHYSFNKGFSEWFIKHDRYSTMEAVETIRQIRQREINWTGLFAKDSGERRKNLKNLSLHVPLRPVVKFFYLFLVRRGFLDGRAGFIYCLLQSIYEYMICLKVSEIQRREKGFSL